MRTYGTAWVIGVGALAGLLIGCQADHDTGYVPDPGPPTFREQLAGRVGLEVAPATLAGGSWVEATATGKLAGEPQRVALELLGGQLEVRTTPGGDLLLEVLEADAGDATLDADVIPPAGCRLTGLHLGLGRIAAGPARWAPDGESVTADAELELVFDWAVDFGDGVVPLATVRVGDIPFSLTLARDPAGGLDATMTSGLEGEFWSVDPWFSLGDLEINVVASTR